MMFSPFHAAKAILDRSVKHSHGSRPPLRAAKLISGRTAIERSASPMRLPDRPLALGGGIKHRSRPAVRDLGHSLHFALDPMHGAGAEIKLLRHA
jgi:hypothetical protein